MLLSRNTGPTVPPPSSTPEPESAAQARAASPSSPSTLSAVPPALAASTKAKLSLRDFFPKKKQREGMELSKSVQALLLSVRLTLEAECEGEGVSDAGGRKAGVGGHGHGVEEEQAKGGSKGRNMQHGKQKDGMEDGEAGSNVVTRPLGNAAISPASTPTVDPNIFSEAAALSSTAFIDLLRSPFASLTFNAALVKFTRTPLTSTLPIHAQTGVDSRETQKGLIRPTVPSLKQKRASRFSPQPPLPPVYSATSISTPIESSPARSTLQALRGSRTATTSPLRSTTAQRDEQTGCTAQPPSLGQGWSKILPAPTMTPPPSTIQY
ncbi:hypothetical protein CPB84DRAFT_1845629 [Gymnopilus junonius]|uniref:Uncharacterized protein n=1 Tax=Gymnopilus junonius TaxID=109634 RepID=A0A9P5NRJ3_GYMJU|nr:hypothetical protein CPB84DRAFT_1845629 [Gymnopilus junonius]